MPYSKGDIEAQGCRIEHKYTDAKQFSFKADVLQRLMGATKWDEIAILWVRFRKLNADFVIMSSHDFERLLQERKETR